MKEKVLLVGAGGHCKVVIDALRMLKTFDIVGIIDSVYVTKNIFGVAIIGDDQQLEKMLEKCQSAVVCLGSIGNPYKRIQLTNYLKKIGFTLPAIIHPLASISKSAIIGDGTFVAAGVVIGPDVRIGEHVIVNTNASIDHDCRIGDFVHIAPGVTVSGGVEIGENSHLGTGATIIEYKKIGANTLIGAGSVVIADISANCKAYGNPCRIIEQVSNVFKE